MDIQNEKNIYMHTSTHLYKYTSNQVHRCKSKLVHKSTNKNSLINKYTSIQVYKFKSTQVYKLKSTQVYKYRSMQVHSDHPFQYTWIVCLNLLIYKFINFIKRPQSVQQQLETIDNSTEADLCSFYLSTILKQVL